MTTAPAVNSRCHHEHGDGSLMLSDAMISPRDRSSWGRGVRWLSKVASAGQPHFFTSPCRASPCPERRCRPRHRAAFRCHIVSPSAERPEGDGWLHEVKYDGHRLIAFIAGGELKLISRNGYNCTMLFRAPFEKLLLAAGIPAMALDGEIAVPDECGVTHRALC